MLKDSSGLRRNLDIFSYSILVIVALLVILPVLFLILGSFSTSSILGDISLSHLGLSNYVEVYSSRSTYKVINNTIIYTVGTVLFALIGGTSFAWILARTDIPFKLFLFTALTISIAVPSLLQAMAWVFLLSPRMGYLNQPFIHWLGRPIYNIYSMPSMIILEGLRMIPAVFLFMWPLLRRIPASLEETAMVCGAEGRTIFRKIVLPLVVPGLIAVSLYITISVIGAFEIPGILGLPARIYVFSTRIYAEIFSPVEANYGTANALSMVFLAILLVGTVPYFQVIKKVHKFEIVTGKAYQPRLIVIKKRTKLILLSLMALYLVLTIFLPAMTLLWTSFTPIPMSPSMESFKRLSLDGWRIMFNWPHIGTTLFNTVTVSVVATVAVIALSFAVAYVLVRTNAPFKGWLDVLAFSPHAVPGVILGISLVWLSLYMDRFLPFNIYGTIWPIAVGFVINFLPFGTRAATTGLLQIHKELEEVGSICGVSKWLVLFKITLPLLLPTVIIVWLWTFGHVFRMTGLPLMLFGSEANQVIGVLLWFMWDSGGRFNAVSALGFSLIAFLLVVSLVLYRIQRRTSVAGES